MKVLIIEDSVDVLNALGKGFKDKKVVTDHCKTGKAGLEKLKANDYDIAILDLMLPDLRGEEVFKQAKAQKVKTPILILTASTDVHKKTNLLEAGAEDFIEKPFTFAELYARIQAILRRINQSAPTEYIKVGHLELLPEKRAVLVSGKDVELKGKEYGLLEYLMKHPDQVVSRQELMEKVWGYSATVLTNTIDAYMYKLRQKVDKDPENKLITTVHGIGFMLVSNETPVPAMAT